MLTVAAFKEPTWMEGMTDFRLWRTVTRAYGAELKLLDPDDPLIFAPDEFVVVVDQQGKQDLEGFVHPANCVYVFGRTARNDLMEIPHGDSIVINYPGSVSLFGFQAAAIVLADRQRKL